MAPALKQLERELRHLRKLVYFDDLTGVFNRRGFKEEAEKVFEGFAGLWHRTTSKGKEPDVAFSIIFIDADNFKRINDVYGHDIGDEVLKKFGKLLQKNTRKSDIVGRWGGEEFVIALFGAPFEDAPLVAERIRDDIENMKIPKRAKRKLRVTASIGLARFGGEQSLTELIHHADQAMYKAKKRGKNRVVIHNAAGTQNG